MTNNIYARAIQKWHFVKCVKNAENYDYLKGDISKNIIDKLMKFGSCTCLVTLFNITSWIALLAFQNLAGHTYIYYMGIENVINCFFVGLYSS